MGRLYERGCNGGLDDATMNWRTPPKPRLKDLATIGPSVPDPAMNSAHGYHLCSITSAPYTPDLFQHERLLDNSRRHKSALSSRSTCY